jgi:predicted nucleotidyltransferase
MQSTQEILDTIQLAKQHLTSTYKLHAVGVFGSVIRGEQRDGNDIDVLVDLDLKADLLDLIGIGQYLEERLHAKVDVVLRADLRQEFQDQVLKEVRYL